MKQHVITNLDSFEQQLSNFQELENPSVCPSLSSIPIEDTQNNTSMVDTYMGFGQHLKDIQSCGSLDELDSLLMEDTDSIYSQDYDIPNYEPIPCTLYEPIQEKDKDTRWSTPNYTTTNYNVITDESDGCEDEPSYEPIPMDRTDLRDPWKDKVPKDTNSTLCKDTTLGSISVNMNIEERWASNKDNDTRWTSAVTTSCNSTVKDTNTRWNATCTTTSRTYNLRMNRAKNPRFHGGEYIVGVR